MLKGIDVRKNYETGKLEVDPADFEILEAGYLSWQKHLAGTEPVSKAASGGSAEKQSKKSRHDNALSAMEEGNIATPADLARAMKVSDTSAQLYIADIEHAKAAKIENGVYVPVVKKIDEQFYKDRKFSPTQRIEKCRAAKKADPSINGILELGNATGLWPSDIKDYVKKI